ncbi:SFT2-domain-containing protein, partial [Aureobasidium melanogenum]
MASSSFRDSMNSLGWSRREPAAMPTTSNSSTPFLGKLQSLNPFGQGGYVRLPLYENEAPGAPLPARTRREEEEGWFALSRWDRLLVFGALNLAAIALFVVCFTLMPVLTLRPRKFAILIVTYLLFCSLSPVSVKYQQPHYRLLIWRFDAATRGGVAEWSPPRPASRPGHAAAPMPPLAPAPGHEQDC